MGAGQQPALQKRSEIGGMINAVGPNWEIGFGFVSCSCRACERARRSCVGVRGDVILNAGGSAGKMSSDSSGQVSDFGFGLVFIARCEGFKIFL